ncbi:glycerate kinase [Agromyces sp. SYSU T0242]|uniref:glycerate kinase n=1 Tax=Agromyces litoreus TaxID=3158561 RepID=UPI0033908923
MRVLVAPDSLKGSLAAADAAEAIAAGWRSARPGDELVRMPMADGGEGTVAAIAATRPDGRLRTADVVGPGAERVRAHWLELPDGTAVVELAQSSGLPLLARPDPLGAHTRGLGETIAAALDAGAQRVVIGLGGSASTDGGAGMLSALGARFLDERGRDLPLGGAALGRLEVVDLAGLRAAPAGGVLCLSDVTSPLLGPDGAAPVFGPQKGADADQVRVLEAGLRRLSQVVGDDGSRPGDGAAGGTGYGLRALWGAELHPGAARTAGLVGVDDEVERADLVITGEGRLDRTSLRGKVVGHLVDRARAVGVPVVVIAGQAEAGVLDGRHGAHVITLADLAGGADAAIADPRRWLEAAGAAASGVAAAIASSGEPAPGGRGNASR